MFMQRSFIHFIFCFRFATLFACLLCSMGNTLTPTPATAMAPAPAPAPSPASSAGPSAPSLLTVQLWRR